jgi:DNA-binding response OmpR family regulator
MSNVTAPTKKTAKKVLVIEDEGEIGLLLNIILNENDFELDYVKDLSSADEYLQKEQPSVIILDNKLPMDLALISSVILRKNTLPSRSS